MNNVFLKDSITHDECIKFWSNLTDINHNYNAPFDWAADTGYGLINIYRDYAGYNDTFIPKINVLHGLFMGMKKEWWRNSEAGIKALSSMIVHYKTSKFFLENLLIKKKNFYAVQHPFHIILKNYQKHIFHKKNGSVFFLPHSIGFGKTTSDKFVINYLNNLPQKFFPIKICIHPSDLNNEILKKLDRDKFTVVCNGNRYDPLFLHRFFWLTNGVRYCLSVDLATQVILSSIAGLDIVPLNKEIPMLNWRHGNQAIFFDKPDKEFWYIIESFFENKIDQDKFREHSNFVTGKHLDLKDKDIFKIFEKSNKDFYSFNIKGIRHRFWYFFEPYKNKFFAYKKAVQNRLSGNNKSIQPWSSDIFYKIYKYHRSFD